MLKKDLRKVNTNVGFFMLEIIFDNKTNVYIKYSLNITEKQNKNLISTSFKV